MDEWHIEEGLLDRFLRLNASKAEAQDVVRHLMTGCPRCSELSIRKASEMGLVRSSAAGARVAWEEAYEEVFTKAIAFANLEEQRLALERLRGWAQWASLEPMKPQLRFTAVENDTRLHTFGLYERLLEAARWVGRSEPTEAVDIVRLAVLVAERLDPAVIGEARKADLLAGAWAALGNAKRIASDFEGARRALNEAWRVFEGGTGDPLEEAHLVSFEASYMKDIGEFEMAESSLEGALRLYQKARDPHGQGRILFQMGDVIGYVNPERAISHIKKALAVIDSAKDPRLWLYAHHDLALFLAESGEPEEALAVLERSRPLFKEFSWDDLTQLHLHWVEGKIAYRIGELAEAESIFVHLWDEFRARNLNQEVVLISIELAEVLAKMGEPARAAQLAADCYSIMANWGLHKDALAAWIVFRDALAEGKAMGDLFERVGDYYRRHWFMPRRFDAPKS